jgi:hypothetical protein
VIASIAQSAPPTSIQVAPKEAEPVAVLNGRPVPLADFRDWLVAAHGWRHLDDFLDLTLLREEATARGVALPTSADLAAAFEQDWQDQILLRHGGVEAGWIEELKKGGIDRAGYRDRRAGMLEIEVLAKQILRLQPMSEDQRRELWQREFGPEGVRTHAQVAFFSQLKSVRPGQRVSTAEAAGYEAEARERAENFLSAVRADGDAFGILVKAQGDPCTVPRFDAYPIDLRERGGELARLRADHFGGVLNEPVGKASGGDLLGPIATPSGFWVVRVIGRTPVPFETAGAELDQIWRERDPSMGEIVRLREELRSRVRIERLPLIR